MITAIVIIAVFFLIVYAFMQQKIFGKNPDAKATEKIKNSANYKDGAFQNLSHTEVMRKGASYPKMIKDFLNKPKTQHLNNEFHQ